MTESRMKFTRCRLWRKNIPEIINISTHVQVRYRVHPPCLKLSPSVKFVPSPFKGSAWAYWTFQGGENKLKSDKLVTLLGSDSKCILIFQGELILFMYLFIDLNCLNTVSLIHLKLEVHLCKCMTIYFFDRTKTDPLQCPHVVAQYSSRQFESPRTVRKMALLTYYRWLRFEIFTASAA